MKTEVVRAAARVVWRMGHESHLDLAAWKVGVYGKESARSGLLGFAFEKVH